MNIFKKGNPSGIRRGPRLGLGVAAPPTPLQTVRENAVR